MDYAVVNKFQCIRVPEGDARKPLCPVDCTMNIQYAYKPTEDDEIFQLRLKFQAHQWNDVFEIQDLDNENTSFR